MTGYLIQSDEFQDEARMASNHAGTIRFLNRLVVRVIHWTADPWILSSIPR